MAASRTRTSSDDKITFILAQHRSKVGVPVGPILNAGKLKALLLADGSSTRKSTSLDLSHSNIRKIELSLGEVAALDFEGLTDLDLHGNLLVLLDGHSLPFPHLRKLRASNCRINSLTNFGSHFRLRQLDLRDNQLQDIMGLADTPMRFTLQALNVANNNIRDFKGLAPLSTFKSLETLDIRGNPLSDFGLVAEGFALICCPILRHLNGRTVSEDVREAVGTWAVDDVCGRATAATVEAFRDTLLHPEGPSLLARTSQPLRIGRTPGPVGGGDKAGSLGSGGTCTGSASTDLCRDVSASESSTSRNTRGGFGEGSLAAVSRTRVREVQKVVKGPLRKDMGSCGSAQEVSVAAANGMSHGRNRACEGQCSNCSGAKLSEREHMESSSDVGEGLNDAASERSVACASSLEHVCSPLSHARSSSKACKQCLGASYEQHYHRTRHVAHDRAMDKSSGQRRRCVDMNCARCSAGTQTPASWIHPLDLTSSSRSVSSVSAKSEDDETFETDEGNDYDSNAEQVKQARPDHTGMESAGLEDAVNDDGLAKDDGLGTHDESGEEPE